MACRRLFYVVMLVGLLAMAAAHLPGVRAQGDPTGPLEVYVMNTPPDGQPGLSRVFFSDTLTGDVSSADVRGQRFTLIGGYVLYEDPDTKTLYRLWPDGRVEQHPFIQPAPETTQIDWVISPDRSWIAWMLTNQVSDGQLQSVTTLAHADGTEPKIILTDGPDAFVRAVPIALTDDGLFFFDRQPMGVSGLFFYPLYASIYRLDTHGEVMSPELLPFEPNCFCGAGLSPDGAYFARLEQVSAEGGFDLRVWDLAARVDQYAPTLTPSYQAAGAVLVSPDGRWVVFSLANNLSIDSAGSGRERFMLALVDVEAGEMRRALSNEVLAPLLPVAWTDGERGVLLTNPRADGTWKLDLESGEVRQVAAGTLLGTLP
jgi:hypothetical protein